MKEMALFVFVCVLGNFAFSKLNKKLWHAENDVLVVLLWKRASQMSLQAEHFFFRKEKNASSFSDSDF